MFIFNLFALKRGQPPQLHVQNGLSLFIAQFKLIHQPGLGLIGVRGVADGLNHVVQISQRDQQAF